MRHILAALLITCGGCATAAPEASPSSNAAAEAEVREVLDVVFDAMRAGDSAAIRAVIHPEARLMSVPAGVADPVVRTTAFTDFIDAVGTPHTEVWDERIWDVVVNVDGPLATAFMQYAFHIDDDLSHCGVNAMQFYRSAEGWKIIHVTDTRRRDGCDPPAGG